MQKVVIGSDHAGFETKERIKQELASDYVFVDVGTKSAEAVDYPRYGEAVAQQVAVTPGLKGVVVCGSGEGIMMAASKVKGVRAGLGYSVQSARGIREHNNGNVLSVPGRNATMDDPVDIVRAFLTTNFSSEERHQRRVDQLMELETRHW